jgi:hypothetical protein
MPYITQEKRHKLQSLITDLGTNLNFDGDLNYVLFALCKRYVKPSYHNYKNFLGELHECQEEVRRRLLSKYEDEQLQKNGDV